MKTLKSQTIELQPFEIADIDPLIRWIGSEAELVQWTGPHFSFPIRREDLVAYQATGEQTPLTRKIYKAVLMPSGDLVGHIALNDLDFKFRSCSLSRVMVNPQFRGQGICLPMVNAALQIAFNQFNIHRISLRVYDFNHSAIRCYKKAGFRQEGLFRHYALVNGQWWDSWTMALLEDEWRNLQNADIGDCR